MGAYSRVGGELGAPGLTFEGFSLPAAERCRLRGCGMSAGSQTRRCGLGHKHRDHAGQQGQWGGGWIQVGLGGGSYWAIELHTGGINRIAGGGADKVRGAVSTSHHPNAACPGRSASRAGARMAEGGGMGLGVHAVIASGERNLPTQHLGSRNELPRRGCWRPTWKRGVGWGAGWGDSWEGANPGCSQ